MLKLVSLSAFGLAQPGFETNNGSFSCGNAFDWYEEEDEEGGEHEEAFRSACLANCQHQPCSSNLAIAYNDSVIPSKDCKLIKPRDQIPSRSDVAGYEDAKGQD